MKTIIHEVKTRYKIWLNFVALLIAIEISKLTQKNVSSIKETFLSLYAILLVNDPNTSLVM
jgi:hypothetical protein